MKHTLIFIVIIFLCRQSIAQDTLSEFNNSKDEFEFNMIFGYNTPVGFWGAEVSYRPNKLFRIFQVSASVGLAIPEGVKLSGGINLLPFKERRLTPIFGGNYTFSLGAWYPSENNTESVKVGQHNYLNPYAGLKLSTRNNKGHIKLLVGYSFLLGEPNVTVIPGTVNSGKNWYDYYVKRVSSDYFFGLGIGGTL